MKVLPTQGWGTSAFLSHLCEHRLQWVGHSRTRWGLIAAIQSISPSDPPGLVLFSPHHSPVHKVQVHFIPGKRGRRVPGFLQKSDHSIRALKGLRRSSQPCQPWCRTRQMRGVCVLRSSFWSGALALCGSEGLRLTGRESMAPHPSGKLAHPHGMVHTALSRMPEMPAV